MAKPVSGAVELRSDTFTRPSAEMRAAMAAAEVATTYMGRPHGNRLETRAAKFWERGGAVVPTGCMGNLVAIKCDASW